MLHFFIIILIQVEKYVKVYLRTVSQLGNWKMQLSYTVGFTFNMMHKEFLENMFRNILMLAFNTIKL